MTLLISITATPNATTTQARAVFQLRVDNLIKHNGGRIYASAQADVAPMSSKTAPRSQVNNDIKTLEKTREVVRRTCREVECGEVGKK